MLTEPTLSPHSPLVPPECPAPHGVSLCWCLPRCQNPSLETNNNGEHTRFFLQILFIQSIYRVLSLIETNYLSFIVFKDYAVVFVFAVALSKLILIIVF